MLTRVMRTLSEEVPEDRRRLVFESIVNAPRILVRKWTEPKGGTWGNSGGGDLGCVMVVAAYGAAQKPIKEQEVYSCGGSHSSIEQFLSSMLGVPANSIYQSWNEWDNGTRRERAELVSFCRDQLKAMPTEVAEDEEVTLPAYMIAALNANNGVGNLVTACLLMMIVLAGSL